MDEVFHRPGLAHELALSLLDPPPVSAVRSGLFLSAPRRTGKSTFLKADLVPALENADARALYVDLWEDLDRDPADTIVSAISEALADEKGAVSRLLKNLGSVESLSAGGFSVSVERTDGGVVAVTMARALLAFSESLDTPIVLIIDEAQHALTSEAGRKALFGLKAARDALNIDRPNGLRIVATGSSRDKLAMLRSDKQQAFFGAPLTSFPPLGRDYVEWVIERMSLGDALDADDVTRWFERSGHRPEILAAGLDAVLYEIGADRSTLAARLRAAMEAEVRSSDEQLMRLVRALTPLQAAVLGELASSGAAYAPFTGATMERYASTMRRIDSKNTLEPNASNVQSALASLAKRGLVWSGERGLYSLEDAQGLKS